MRFGSDKLVAEHLLALLRRCPRRPRRRAILWRSAWIDPGAYALFDTRDGGPWLPLQVRGLDAVVVAVHPDQIFDLAVALASPYALEAPVDVDSLVAEGLVELAVRRDPTLRFLLHW